jgi:hypothetical protein
MNAHFVGCFYFKKTSNGNLFGEYLNNGTEKIGVEVASVEKVKDGFEGSYSTTWYEDGVFHQADLHIERNTSRFMVTWKRDGLENYSGFAMLVDDTLIGYYHLEK